MLSRNRQVRLRQAIGRHRLKKSVREYFRGTSAAARKLFLKEHSLKIIIHNSNLLSLSLIAHCTIISNVISGIAVHLI